MKHESHIRQCKYYTIILIILCICASSAHSNCPIKGKIRSVPVEGVFGTKINAWSQEGYLNKYCNFEIGKKYFEFFKTNQNQMTLQNAITYLEYASEQLTIRDSKYRECHNLFLKAITSSVPLDIDTLIKYCEKIKKDDHLKNNVQSSFQKTIIAYKNDPFNVTYPDKLIDNLNLLTQECDIFFNIDVNSVKRIPNLITNYKTKIQHLETNQSKEQVNVIMSLLVSFEKSGVNNIPKSIGVKALQQYHHLYSNSLTSGNACELLGMAFSNLNKAKMTFPFLTDIYNIECHQPLVCLLSEIETNIQSLMPSEQNWNQYANNLSACNQYKTRYNTAINKCPNVQPIVQFPTLLNDLIAFYSAYNSLPESLDNIIIFMINNTSNQLTNAIRLNEIVKTRLREIAQNKISAYINNPFNQNYPNFLNNINTLNQYDIQIDDVNDLSQIPQLVQNYNTQLQTITSNQSPDTIIGLLDLFSSIGVNNVPNADSVRALHQYHQLNNQSLLPENRSQACTLLDSALNHLQTAQNTFSFLTDSLDINCHKPLACLLSEINIQSLLPNNINQFVMNLDGCQAYKTSYNTAKNNYCTDVQPIFHFPAELDDLIKFYSAYNSLDESPGAFIGFMDTNTTEQLTNAIKSNEIVKQRIRESAQTVIDNYINDPFNSQYPEQLATSIQLFSRYNIQINANNLQSINQLVDKYKNQLNTLTENQLPQNVNSIIASLDSFSEMGVQNVPKSNAVRALQKYYQLYTQSLQSANRSRSCELLNSALTHLNTARNTFTFLTDSLNINCYKNLACLLLEINIQELMPDIENENQYTNNLITCEKYQTNYNNVKTQCPNLQTSFQLPTQLDDLIKFYNAHNSLISQPNIHPTDLLSNFMNNIQNNQKLYAKKLYNLAGFYIANYYYQKSYKQLSKGPGQNRDETLRQIRIINDKLNKNYINMEVDVFNQYSKILEFFNSYQDKPVSETKTILSEIDQNIRQAWRLDALLTAEIEKRKQEELAIQKKKQQDAPEKKKQQDTPEKKKQQVAPEKKKQQDVLAENQEKLDSALKKFKATDYIKAWELYGEVYSFLDSSNLSRLLNKFNIHPPRDPILKIDIKHKQPIQILCEIMHIKNFQTAFAYNNYLINHRKQYGDLYGWHINMLDNTDCERTSNQKFFYGLYYYIVKPDVQKTIDHFKAAYVNLKKMTTPPENKMKRVKFWLKKAWDLCTSKEIKSNIFNQHKKDLPEIFGEYLKIDESNIVHDNQFNEAFTGLSITNYELFSKNFQESYEILTCEYIQKNFPTVKIENENDKSCLIDLSFQVKQLVNVKERSSESFRFYFAFASIRKGEKDYVNWIENLCIAYDSIPKNKHQTSYRQDVVKKELALAKMYMNNSALSKKNTENLRNVGLLKEWRKIDFVQKNLKVNVFSNYNEAKNAFDDIDCTVQYETKTPKLQQLLYTYRVESDNAAKLKYTDLFIQFIERCINKKEKKFWTDLWLKKTNQ